MLSASVPEDVPPGVLEEDCAVYVVDTSLPVSSAMEPDCTVEEVSTCNVPLVCCEMDCFRFELVVVVVDC